MKLFLIASVSLFTFAASAGEMNKTFKKFAMPATQRNVAEEATATICNITMPFEHARSAEPTTHIPEVVSMFRADTCTDVQICLEKDLIGVVCTDRGPKGNSWGLTWKVFERKNASTNSNTTK